MASYGELATRATIWLAMLGYFVGAALRSGREAPLRHQIVRIVWTSGCLFYLAHVACAFHFFHHWSHADAYHRTAVQTAAVTGWDWGGGIFFNYAFTAVWVADTLVLWLPPAGGAREQRLSVASEGRPYWVRIAIQSFMWFMVFNATVVFGHGTIRWLGLAGCVWLLVLGAQRFAPRRGGR
ncbi:MAG TPA: hypothetical protein VHC22_33560 [Pirellulales bacterium]|nr:hypothetical protein [Pirellulales bacterium]